MNTQGTTPLALVSLLCALSLFACNKRTAGPEDEVKAGAENSRAGSVTDDVYSGGLGRSQSGAASVSGNTLSATGRQFLSTAAQNGTLEIQAGRLAAEKSKSLQVKQFADMMVQAHSRVNDDVMQLAHANGVEITAAPGADGQQLLEKLRGLSGAEFDKTYSEEMLKAHRKAVQNFATAAQSASDPQIQSFAQAQLPAMRDHLRIAQTLPGPNTG